MLRDPSRLRRTVETVAKWGRGESTVGWWASLLEMLGFDDGPDVTPPRVRSTSSQEVLRDEPPTQHGPGALLDGVVEYVGGTFVKVRSGSIVAIVFQKELANERIDNPADVVSLGDHVQFVLLGPSTKKPGEWVASLAAADEARMRAHMRSLPEGAELDCRILTIKDKGVELDCEGLHGWAPLGELSHAWIDHPADCIQLGQTLRGRVTRLDCPNNWLERREARKARLIVSLKACMSAPESPLVEMPFNALPFRLTAQPRKPRACDAVVLYVLEELNAGVTMEAICAATGITMSVLQAILRVLEREGLVRHGKPTPAGSKLAETMHNARRMNETPPRGLFVSTAPPASMFVKRGVSKESRRYPAEWPRLPFNARAERSFLGDTDEALPQELIDCVTDEPMRASVLDMLQDKGVRIFLRRDTAHSAPRIVYLLVPAHWVLAGLWSVFEPVGTPPFRPASLKDRCRHFLLVRIRVPGATPDQPTTDFYYEPVTATFWTCQPDVTPLLKELPETAFPEMPPLPLPQLISNKDENHQANQSENRRPNKHKDEGASNAPHTTDAAAYERRWCRVKT